MWSIHYGLNIPPPTHCSKGNFEYVLKCTKFPQKQANGYMFQTKCSLIKQRNMKLGDCFQKKRGNNKHTCPMFDNDFLASSKQIKLCTRDYIFPIKQEDICDYNPLCFMSIGLMLDDIIINLFTDTTKTNNEIISKDYFSKIKDDTIHLYKGSLQDFTRKRKILMQKRHYVCIITLKEKNQENICLVSYIWIMMRHIKEIRQISSSMILPTLITNLSFSSTTNLNPIYLKNHVTYHSWQKLDSWMVKLNQDVMSTRPSK